jgi:Ca2+-binding EF-hand superfamily protein
MYLDLNKTILATLLVGFIAIPTLRSMAEDIKTQTQTRTYSYDTNKDGYIQPEEFTTYLYTKSDMDGDGYMGDEEWKLTTSQLYRPYKDVNYNNYTYWDQDKDNRLDNNEVKTLIEKTGLYSKWDTNTDGKVSNAEFEAGTFNSYDDNSDGTLSLKEWESVLR